MESHFQRPIIFVLTGSIPAQSIAMALDAHMDLTKMSADLMPYYPPRAGSRLPQEVREHQW